MELLKKYSAGDELDPQKVLEYLPEEWEIMSDGYDMLQYLKNMFERLLTIEENQRIASKMSEMEVLTKQRDHEELKSAYLVIEDNQMCKICKRIIGVNDFIKVFPNGGVYHAKCAKENTECPLTKQSFKLEIE